MHLCGFLYNNTNPVRSGSTILSLNMSYLSSDNAIGTCWCTTRFGTTYYGGSVILNSTNANIVIGTNYSGDIGEIMVDISYKLRNP